MPASARARIVSRRRPRLERAGEAAIERRHRERDGGQPFLGHIGENVDVALDERRFGDDAHRMVELLQHLEDAARDPELALGRLIGIGIGAHGDRLACIPRLGELGLEQPGRFRLDEDAALEIEPGRQAEIGMGRAGEAIDAAMLAAAIGVDRAVETNIRRGVAGDDRLGAVDDKGGLQRYGCLVGPTPAIVEGDALLGLEAADRIAQRAAAFARQGEIEGSHPPNLALG
jgi:hypothetical protein